MKSVFTMTMIALLFCQSVFAKGRPRPHREVRYSSTTTYTRTYGNGRRHVDYDVHEFTACYERPRTKVIEIHDRAQRQAGGNMMAIGAAAVVLGLVLTGDRDTRNLGRFTAGAGALIAAAGAINYNNSAEVWYEHNGYDCQSYYQVDSYRYQFRRDGHFCSTTRHYSHRWGGTHEYFVTDCGPNRRFISFERHHNIWRRR